MTPYQRGALAELMAETRAIEFHYGDCVGVDEQAFWMGVELGWGGVYHAHPATGTPEWIAKWCARTYLNSAVGVEVHEAKHPLERNKDIVLSSDVLWAFPGKESSGTWYTVEYAKKHGIPIVVHLP